MTSLAISVVALCWLFFAAWGCLLAAINHMALHRGRLSRHVSVLGRVGIYQTLGGISVLIPPIGLMLLLRSPAGIEGLLEISRVLRPFNAFALAGVIPWFLTWIVLNRVVRANAGMKDVPVAPATRIAGSLRLLGTSTMLLSFPFLLALPACPPQLAILGKVGYLGGIFAVLGTALLYRKSRVASASSSTLPEDTPLKSDLDTIVSAFGYETKPWRLISVRLRSGAEADRAGLLSEEIIGWTARLRPSRPHLPALLLQAVDPGVVTAMVAIRFARLPPPWRRNWWLRWIPVAGARLLVGVVAVAVIFSVWLSGLSLRTLAVTLLIAIALLVVSILLYVLTRTGRGPDLVRAYEAWRLTRPGATREDFLALVGLGDLAIHRQSPKWLGGIYRNDPRIAGFLDLRPGDDPDGIYQRLVESWEAATVGKPTL